MSSIFSWIVKGEIPCAKVWENEEFLAFLDILPIQIGHTLVIPKQETDYLFDLDPAVYARLMAACRTVAEGLKRGLDCRRVCVIVAGFEVPHVHVHLIPANGPEDFPFPPRRKVAPEELRSLAGRLAAQLAGDSASAGGKPKKPGG